MVVRLSELSPDYESLAYKLQSELSTRDAWKDLLTAGAGEAIIEFMASVGYYNQLGTIRAAHEGTFLTARLSTSIYAMTSLLGVHIQRRIPSKVTTTLTRKDSSELREIAAYTEFTVNEYKFFNRSPIVFNVGQATVTNIDLHEGYVVTEDFESNGLPFQRLSIGQPGMEFAISDQDIVCKVGNLYYEHTTKGIWHFGANERAFYENTLPSGYVEVIFGNNVYGAIPPVGQVGTFTYAVTSGALSNTPMNGSNVKMTSDSTVTGTVTSGATGGAAHKDAEFYRVMAPKLFSAKERAVTRNDYQAIISTYPGVLDVKVRGQAEIAQNNVSWTNVIEITLITEWNWTDNEWIAFTEWLDKRDNYTVHYVRRIPNKVLANIEIDVFCYKNVDLVATKSKIENMITNQFKVGINTLGKSQYRHDIHSRIKDGWQTPTVDYAVVKEPVIDWEVDPFQYVELNNLTVNMHFSGRDAPPLTI